MLLAKPKTIDKLERVLPRVGWKYSRTALLPIEIFDTSDLKDIPQNAHEDILKSASRLRDGDLSVNEITARTSAYEKLGVHVL